MTASSCAQAGVDELPAPLSRRARSLAAPLLLAMAGLLLAACGSSSTSSSSTSTTAKALPAGLTKYGYSTVKASVKLSPGKAAKVHSGNISVHIPKKAVPEAATFQLLEGTNSYWQAYAPHGQKVVANFAFRVVNSSTGQLITTFKAPIVVRVRSKAITAASKYWNTTAASPPAVKANPVPPKIKGHVLTHGNKLDPVGWLVTSP
ncbi:MAG: hypothetical protein ACYDH5_02370 [Acidimicrobiales bacterium]